MKPNLSLALKIAAVFFLAYIPMFLLGLYSLEDPGFRSVAQVRGSVFVWDYELMLVVIYAVWGVYLWKAAKNPQSHVLFIDFTIWANIAHGLVMILIGVLREGELAHLSRDSLQLLVPALLLIRFRKSI